MFDVKTLILVASLFTMVACGGGETDRMSATGSEQTNSGTPGTSGGGSDSDSGGSSDTVPGTTTYTATLSWVAPATYTDGSPMSLSQIDGYRIYYGNTSGQYTDVVDVTDGSADTYVLNGLSSGTYFFTITAYDTNGLESDYGQEVTISY